MSESRYLIAILWFSVAVSPAGADLQKIDRTLAKEPAFQTKSPGYCLLVFGPEAKTRVWLIRDGAVLYVDRNGNGDLTEKDERHTGAEHSWGIQWQIGEIVEADGTTRHSDLRARYQKDSFSLSLRTAEGIHQEVGELGRLRFAERAEDAPIVHFAGPLTFLLQRSERPFEMIRGEEAHFIALLGTPGLGEGTAAYSHIDAFLEPGAFQLVVEAEFPGPTPDSPLRARRVFTDY